MATTSKGFIAQLQNNAAVGEYITQLRGSAIAKSAITHLENNALIKISIPRYGLGGTIGIALISALFLFFALGRLRTAYLSPLSKIPGPWHAHLTGVWLKLNILWGNRVNYVQGLHEKYGPYVRVAHNEVVTCDPRAAKEMHSVGTKWRKWSHIPDDITPNVFSVVEPKQHNIRQRFYAKTFSQAGLRKSMEPSILALANQAAQGIEKTAKSDLRRLVNVHEWFMLFGNDVMYQLTFGEGFGLMDKGKGFHEMVTPIPFHKMIAWTEFSVPLFLVGRFLLSPLSSRMKNIFCADQVLNPDADQALAQLRMEKKGDEGRTVFARAIEDAKADEMLKSSGKTRLTDDEIAADALGFRLAGSEPVAVTVTYLVWCVLSQPKVQKQLEQELSQVSVVSDESTEKLPILTAVILETLRLWGGNATAMRRVENLTSKGTVLGGRYFIPQGATVATQAYSIHRNPEAWEDPERWDHTRWLDPAQSHALSQDNFQPFSAGTRMCAAYHLAMMEIRIMTAIFFKTFPGAKLAPSATTESMRMIDRFNLLPAKDKLEVLIARE